MKIERAYSMLNVKSLDEDKDERIIRGVATTPNTDRLGDIVEPLGVNFNNPMPLLFHHQSDKPIGLVTFDKPTKNGITFEARIPKLVEPGTLKDRVDEAWQSIKSGLVTAVSIGFRAVEFAFLQTGGVHFLKCDVYELSLVTIPANADATISVVRSIDSALLTASGRKQGTPPGASGKSGHSQVVSIKSQAQRSTGMKVLEQIKSFEDARSKKAERMAALMEEVGAKGETLNAEQSEEYDTLATEIKSIDTHIDRLTTLQTEQERTAKPAAGDTTKNASTSRDPQLHTTVRSAPKLEPGVRFARLAHVKGLSAMHSIDVIKVAEERYKDDTVLVNVLKADVLGGTTITGNWAANLVGDETSAFADFIEFLRPQTILGKFGAGGVPNLRRVPFRVPLVGQTGGGSGYWVGEGQPKPLTSFDFSRTTLEPLKVANIAVVTMELLRDSSPSADLIIRDSLAAALRERLDIDFIDPAKAASPGVSPASITNGATSVGSTGNTADDIRADIKALFALFIAAENPPSAGVWIMSTMIALALSLMQNPLGQAEFPGISMTGGTLFGLPVIISDYVPTPSGGSIVALVNASDIYMADEGGINVDVSREASVQMLDNPTNNVVTPTPTTMVSLWQTNSVGFRAERTINWARRRASGVAYLTAVNWGS